jgi:uncharacterized protein YdaU (DUF1376 family)
MEDEMPINNWMPVYTRDILASCADMSATQFGGYMRLLLYAWDSGGLPNDMEACCRIAGGLAPSDWQVVRKRLVVIDAGTSEERLSHPRLEQERAKAQQGYDKKVAAISKARAARAANTDHSTDHSIDDSTDDSIDHSAVNSPVNKRQPQPQPEPQPQPPCIKNETPNGVSTSGSGSRRRTYRISWDCEGGFQGHAPADIARWKQAYPGVDLAAEMRVAHAWLCDNPSKAGKRNWAAFLNRWFSRCQEKGGSKGAAPPPTAKRRYYRGDAQQSLTDEEYERWKSGATSLGDEIRERTRRAAGPAAE